MQGEKKSNLIYELTALQSSYIRLSRATRSERSTVAMLADSNHESSCLVGQEPGAASRSEQGRSPYVLRTRVDGQTTHGHTNDPECEIAPRTAATEQVKSSRCANTTKRSPFCAEVFSFHRIVPLILIPDPKTAERIVRTVWI